MCLTLANAVFWHKDFDIWSHVLHLHSVFLAGTEVLKGMSLPAAEPGSVCTFDSIPYSQFLYYAESATSGTYTSCIVGANNVRQDTPYC